MLEIHNQCITATSGKVFSHNNTHQLHLLGMRSHCVCGHNPSTFTQEIRRGEFVIEMFLCGIQTHSNEWKTFATTLGHDNEAYLLQRCREVICGSDEIE